MKLCPECRRDYYDETLIFCLDDGARLLSGPTGPLSRNALYQTGGTSANEVTQMLPTIVTPWPLRSANTIAVLPFLNLSRDEEGDYFSDGLAEELLNVLSKIPALRVAARTSAFSFKGKQTTVSEIGNILNVASVLEGSIRRAGSRVRISVQLVKVEDGYHLWSETYDRTMDDIFAVQDDIARSVVEEIRIRLLGESSDSLSRQIERDVARAVRGRPDDPEAQRLMMLGRYFLDRTTREDSDKAIGYFKQALEIDPEYALCWAELGRAYAVGAGRGWLPPDEGFKLAGEAADRSLSLEPDLAEGHAQLGRIKAVYEWDLHGAEAAYKRAMELAPSNSSVLDGASVLAYKLVRLDEAVDLSRRTLAQDPLATGIWHNLGLACHAAGLLDESEKAFRRAMEIAPQRIVSGALLSLVILDLGRTEDAISQAEREPDEFWRRWAQAIIHHAAGERERSDESLQAVLEKFAEGNAFQIAEIYSMRGEMDEAFEWLGKAIDARDPGVTHIKVNPRFRPMQADGRWPQIIENAGLG